MREPKKVPLHTPERFPKSRKQLKQEFEREIWEKLHKLGKTSSASTVNTGSAAFDERLKRTIGAPKGDPTVGLWHGEQTGSPLYPGTNMTVTQYRRMVLKNGVHVCTIWVDDTVKDENEIARQFGGDSLMQMPLGTPFAEYTRRFKRAMDDPNRANKE